MEKSGSFILDKVWYNGEDYFSNLKVLHLNRPSRHVAGGRV